MSMTSLPLDTRLPEILDNLSEQRRIVLVAPPGAGKTTRVPPAIVRAGLLTAEHPALVLLQPRRVAARATAARIAEENGWALGAEVGYQVRFERRAQRDTRLLVATEGILTRRLVGDPFLEGVGAVVLDEFHERSLHTDLALTFLREIRETVREDLMLVVMSATLEAEPVAHYLGGCPVLRVEARSFPVAIQHRPRSIEPLHAQVAQAVEHALLAPEERRDRGDLLVFLPGWEEIRRAARALEPLAEREGLIVLPLHGRLSAEEQDRALRPADRRKVVLATNVAETSLTIDGVQTVIDSGLARYASHDPRKGLDRLVLGRISRASAEQRAGRAGRTGPGQCIRLWSPREEHGMALYDEPEIRRADLCATVLALHAWGHDDLTLFDWFEAPRADALASAQRLLVMLGAIETEHGPITPLGRRLLELPVHPRLACLLLSSASEGLLREGAALAALLSEKDIVAVPAPIQTNAAGRLSLDRGASDLLVRLDRLAEAEHARFGVSLRIRGIDPHAARQVARARDELVRLCLRLPCKSERKSGRGDEHSLLKLVLFAYPDRVTRRRGSDQAAGVMVGGRGVRLEAESVVRDAEFFLALDPREDKRGGTLEARVRIASAVRVEWLEALFPASIRRERLVQFDEARQRAVAVQQVWYRDLLLREDRNAPVELDDASAALAEALVRRADEFVRSDAAAAAWLARIEFLRRALPDDRWPAFDDARMAELVASLCAGKRTVEEVRRIPLVPRLKGELTHAENRRLDAEAPEALMVPSGCRIQLTYRPDGPPILAVRLQELFGWTDTPRVAAGRIPVVLRLLGPNFRPVQVTDDLRSFWTTTYHQVRKDLRARYPKHAWPEDPWTARAETKGGRRRS